MPRTHLFIDTNVLLNFYHFADDGLEQLEHLISLIAADGIALHLPQQVINELARNREAKLKAAIDQFSKEPLPSTVPRHMHQYVQHAEYVAAIEQAKKLRSQLVGLALGDASNNALATDGLMRSVFANATKYPEDDDVFAIALKRMQKGNPPGKNGSVGDQYNWETLLKELPDGDLHIVSKDGDYSSLINKSRPHPSLEAEWVEKKSGHLHLYSELRAFLKRYEEMRSQGAEAQAAQPVSPAPVPPTVQIPPPAPVPPTLINVVPNSDLETETAIQLLINSRSFATTHSAVTQLDRLKNNLRPSDVGRLIQAAVSNDQIRWIASDSDVYTFFVSALTDHPIDPDLFEAAVDVFGLRPDPEDPSDDM